MVYHIVGYLTTTAVAEFSVEAVFEEAFRQNTIPFPNVEMPTYSNWMNRYEKSFVISILDYWCQIAHH